jgi:DNA-binding response OmpR family regulator
MRELIARIRAVLRRVAPEVAQPEVLRAGDLRLDLSAHTLHRDDRLVRLTPSEFELLATLMAAPGRAFTRLELLERLQGIAIEGVEHTVNTHIHNLRAKIEPDPGQPRYIEAVFGVGYRFRGE